MIFNKTGGLRASRPGGVGVALQRATAAACSTRAGTCTTRPLAVPHGRLRPPRRSAGLLQVVSRRIRVDQRRERDGVENAFIAEQPSDGGIYRAGRGFRPQKRVRVPRLLRDALQLTYAARVQLIYPERRPTSPEELASPAPACASWRRAGRPYLGINMVSSLDGKATLDWRTKGLSTEIDRRLFHHLRTQADAVMVGAGTVREERYGRMTKNDELRQKRMDEGRVADALAVVVSGRLDLPPDLPLLNEPEQRGGDRDGVGRGDPWRDRASVEYARTGDDLPRLLAYLHEEHGVRSVLCEGGPTLNSFLFAAGLVDELFLTLNPKVLGGASAAHDRRGARARGARRARSRVRRGARGRALHALAVFPLIVQKFLHLSRNRASVR